MSDKRRKDLNKRTRVREEVLKRDRYTCTAKEILEHIQCWGPLDVDEIIGRGRGGDWLDPDNCQVLCRAHHTWKHDNPAEALELGLSDRLGPNDEDTSNISNLDGTVSSDSESDSTD